MKSIKLFANIHLFYSLHLYADQYHYNNMIVGERAIGMGGAYTAVSDDSSGIYYNPGGLGFALSNDISGTANAFYNKKIIYEKTIGGKDFNETIKGSVPSFFGGLQKLDSVMERLVFAFAMYSPDSETKDQNDLIENVNLQTPNPCQTAAGTQGEARPAIQLERLHRTVMVKASTNMIAGALGYRLSDRLSLGMGVYYVSLAELVQEYQDVTMNASFCHSSKDGGFDVKSDVRSQNARQSLQGMGGQVSLGGQYIWKELTFGLSAKLGQYVSQSFLNELEFRRTVMSLDDQNTVDIHPNALFPSETDGIQQSKSAIEAKEPFGVWIPSEYRAGVAYFPSPSLLLAYDLFYVGSVKGEMINGLNKELYTRNSVLNQSAGVEYYLMGSLPLRLGIFTNNDARPKLVQGQYGQDDHVDYLGYSLAASWVQPNSQVGVGVVYQKGTGEAQKIGAPSTDIQKVQATSLTFTISATHSM